MNIINNLIIIYLISNILSPILASENNKIKEKAIIAVNKEIILQSELNKYINIFFLLSNTEEKKLSKQNKYFKKELLEDITINKIQLQLAKKYNLKINNDKVKTIFNEYARKEKKSITEYSNYIKNKYVPYKILYDYIKESLLIEKLQKSIIELSISNSEIENFINLSSDIKKISDTKYNAVYIQLNSNAKHIANKTKWLIKLLYKSNNHNYIKKYTKQKIHDLSYEYTNWQNINNTPYIINKNISISTPGILLGPIYLNNKLHFIKLLNKKRILDEDLNMINIRYILIKKRSLLKFNNKLKYLQNIRNNILNTRSFTKQIINHSENKNLHLNATKNKWLNKNNVSNHFYNHISLLSKSEISYPFNSELGSYIVEIIDKKYINKHFNQMILYHKIEKLIINYKFDKLKDNWIKKLKNEAIIKLL